MFLGAQNLWSRLRRKKISFEKSQLESIKAPQIEKFFACGARKKEVFRSAKSLESTPEIKNKNLICRLRTPEKNKKSQMPFQAHVSPKGNASTVANDTDGAISCISRVLAIGLWWGERLELSTSARKRAHHPKCKIVCEAFVCM